MITKWELIDIPTIRDSRGDLTVIEEGLNIAFAIKRVFFIHNIPTWSERGGHTNKQVEELIIAVRGRFKVELNDASTTHDICMDSPNKGLYIGPMVWRTFKEYEEDSICLVLASNKYDELDYIRNYGEYRSAMAAK